MATHNQEKNISVNMTFGEPSKVTVHALFKLICPMTIIVMVILWFCQTAKFNQLAISITTKLELIELSQLNINVFLVTPRWNATSINRLPNLTRMQWPPETVAPYPAGRREPSNRSIAPLPQPFDPVVSSGQRRVFQDLLNRFARIMSENGLGDRYFLTGGTLLGSFRHHDLIPWDDDVDVLVDDSVRPELRILLHSLETRYRFVTDQRDKLYTQLLNVSDDNEQDLLFSRQSTSYQWGWPFLDISYYHVNSTHVIENEAAHNLYYAWPRDVVFPLYLRPFLGAWYPAPRNPLAFLVLTYGTTSMCTMPGYSHVLERSGPSGSVLCHALGARYAFVEHKPCIVNRETVRQGSTMLIEERLIIRSRVIHAFCLAGDVSNAYSETYSLDIRK